MRRFALAVLLAMSGAPPAAAQAPMGTYGARGAMGTFGIGAPMGTLGISGPMGTAGAMGSAGGSGPMGTVPVPSTETGSAGRSLTTLGAGSSIGTARATRRDPSGASRVRSEIGTPMGTTVNSTPARTVEGDAPVE